MIKRVLLFSTTALGFSGATGQAADVLLPEPEPVEYVRVCDAYGEGYFYIPGTDTCMRIGGLIYSQIKGGDNVYARSRNERRFGKWDTSVRNELYFDTRKETELGTLRSYIGFRTEFNNGFDEMETQMRFGFIELGGLHVGLDESSFNTFFGYYGNFINDDVQLGGAYRTNMIQYTYTADNGFSAMISLEEGGDEDTDYNGTIDDYTPHVVLGAKYKRDWGSLTGAGAYDARNEDWMGKAKIDLNVTEKLNLWLMGAYKDRGDTYYEDIDDLDSRIVDRTKGVRAIDSFYGTWGGNWAGWLGATYQFTPKTAGNLQLAYEGAGNSYVAANINYELVPGLTVMPEINYRQWNDIHSELDGRDAIGGAIHLQREF